LAGGRICIGDTITTCRIDGAANVVTASAYTDVRVACCYATDFREEADVPQQPRKHRMRITLRLLLTALAMGGSLTAIAATFIAPEPRDSVTLAGPMPDASPTFRIFLSKQAPEDVQAFYAAKLGAFTKKSSASYEAQSPVVLTYQQVLDILLARHRDETLADDLFVTIKWKPVPSGHASCNGDFFQQLNVIAQTQHRQSEFEALCKQYGYLDNAFFQRVPDSRRPGQWVDADKDILARAHDTLGGQQTKALAGNTAEIAQRLQQLTLGGQTGDAKALAEQLKQQVMQTSGSVLDWDGWVKVLKEADAMAYRTWIMLPTHPSTW
jgi:hypothetical protein